MLREHWQRNIAALLFAQTLVMIAFSFVFPFIPLFIQSLGVKDMAEVMKWSGAQAAASSVAMIFVQPIWGTVADRWGRRPMVVRSMFSAGVVIALMNFVSTPEQLLILRFLQGALTGTVPASTALISSSTPPRHLGFALGLMQVAMFLGNSVGPLIGGVVADTFGFHASFIVASALMFTGTLIVVAVVREDFKPAPAGHSQGSILGNSLALVRNSSFSTILIINFLIMFGGVIVAPFLPLFISELNAGEGAATASGLVMAGAGIASAISAIVIGRQADRFGRRVIVLVCLIGATLVYFPQSAVRSLEELLALRLLLGVFSGGLMPAINALVADAIPTEKRGVAFGLTASCNALANTIGPLTGAGIATQWGMRSVFLVTGTLFALATSWTTFAFRARPRLAQQVETEN